MRYFFCTRAVTTRVVAVLALFSLFAFAVAPVAHAQVQPSQITDTGTAVSTNTTDITQSDTTSNNSSSTGGESKTNSTSTEGTTPDTTTNGTPKAAFETILPEVPELTFPAASVLDTPTGTITVCKVVLNADGALATGTSGETYSVALTDSTHASIGTATFTAPLAYNADVLSDIAGNDATCQTFNNLALALTGQTTFTYSAETTTGNSAWEAPRYAVLATNTTTTSTSTDLATYGSGAITLAMPTTQGGAMSKVLVVVNKLKPTPQPVENSCMLPDALGDTTTNVIHDSGEKTLQQILTDSGYSIHADTDQTKYQLWHVVAGQTVTVDAKFLDGYAMYGNVFGYYTNGDVNTFTPLFKRGAASDYEKVPDASNGSSYTFTVPSGVTTIGFAIKSYNGSYVGTVATEHGLNPNGVHNTVVYNPMSNVYVIGFEDLVSGSDYDYNDVVVSIHINCTTTTSGGGGSSTPQCSDGIDNDNDGLIDAADPGCHSDGNANNSASYVPTDNDETNTTNSGGGGGGNNDDGTGGGSLQCIDGLDNDGDGLIDAADPGCHTDGNANNPASYDPTDNDETNVLAQHSSHHSSSSSSNNDGQVLGASACSEYLHSYIKIGKQNDTEDVSRLQRFLNDYLGLSLPVTGFYDTTTFDAVKQFQLKESPQVLIPWVGITLPNADQGTGWVYKTTKRWINMIKCPDLNLPMPELTIDPQDL